MKLLKNTVSVTCISILFSISCFSQLFCELGSRNNLLPNIDPNPCEYSGLAHHPGRGIFIMPIDDPIGDNIYFRGYDINNGEDVSFNITISNTDSLTKDDLEGLTYLKDDYFVLVEEKENKIYFLEYKTPDFGNPYFEILSGHATDIPSINSKNGLEGVSFDPNTNRLYMVREKERIELFSVPVTLPAPGFSGGISEQQLSSVILPLQANADASGLFHLGKIYQSDSDLSNNLLLLSHQLKKIFEFKLLLDSNGNLSSNSLIIAKEIQILREPQPEGIVLYNNKIYIASEEAGGGLSSYAINPGLAPCNTDCTIGAIEVRNTATCECEPSPNAGCTDSIACNYDASATIDDCSCVYTYSTCDDGDDNTINDLIRKDCVCKGIQACKCQQARKTE